MKVRIASQRRRLLRAPYKLVETRAETCSRDKFRPHEQREYQRSTPWDTPSEVPLPYKLMN